MSESEKKIEILFQDEGDDISLKQQLKQIN